MRGEGLKRCAQALRIGCVVALLPVAVITRRIGKEQQADQEFETGEIQIGARPVRPSDFCVCDLIRTNRDGYIVPDYGNPRIGDEVEGHRILSLLNGSRTFRDDPDTWNILGEGHPTHARDTRGDQLARNRAGYTDTRDMSAGWTHRYSKVRPHSGS